MDLSRIRETTVATNLRLPSTSRPNNTMYNKNKRLRTLEGDSRKRQHAQASCHAVSEAGKLTHSVSHTVAIILPLRCQLLEGWQIRVSFQTRYFFAEATCFESCLRVLATPNRHSGNLIYAVIQIAPTPFKVPSGDVILLVIS